MAYQYDPNAQAQYDQNNGMNMQGPPPPQQIQQQGPPQGMQAPPQGQEGGQPAQYPQQGGGGEQGSIEGDIKTTLW